MTPQGRVRRCIPGLALVLAMPLAGCSGDDDPATETPTANTTQSPTSAPTSAVDDPVLTAIATAQATAPGSRAVHYERGEGGTSLEVEVLAGNLITEVTLSSDGTQVIRTEQAEPLEADDAAGASAATVPMESAIATAQGQAPGSVVEEAGLETGAAQLVWEVEFLIDGNPRDVYVDAGTGSIVS